MAIKQIKVGSTNHDLYAKCDGAGNIITNTYLPKLTYEWNKSYNAGGTAGYLLIGSFPMYDSNVTIDIDSTTTTTYHGTVVIATQNVSETSIGSAHTITVYGDPTGAISDAIRVVWKSGSRNYSVYFVPSTWSKNLIHIRAIGQYLENTDNSKICTQFTTGTAPATTSGLTVVNALKSNFNNYTHPTTSGNKHIPSGGSSGQILRWSADGTAAWGADSDTDTKNTAGSTDSSSKLFLIGATSQAANPQTYSHNTAYVGTDGCLYSNSTKVSVEGHAHNYAASSSAGGAASTVAVTNTTPTSATTYYPLYATGVSGAQTVRANTDLYYYDAGTWAYLNIGSSSQVGGVTLHYSNGYYANVATAALTANRDITLPNASGTVITTGNLPTPATLGAATSAQGTKADNAMPKSGGTFTGAVDMGSNTFTTRKVNFNGSNSWISDHDGSGHILFAFNQNNSSYKGQIILTTTGVLRPFNGSGEGATGASANFKLGLVSTPWTDVVSKSFRTPAGIFTTAYTGSGNAVWVADASSNPTSYGLKSSKALSSSRTIKHDIKPLEDEHLKAENLYDINIYQAKYNADVIAEDDCRYLKDIPMFIIEEMDETYPIAITKPMDDVKSWNWEPAYMIPPMLKLIQDQKKQIDELEKRLQKLEEAK